MIVGHQRKQRLTPGERHHAPEQQHRHMRGHQAHLDVTEHTDPSVLIRVDFEVSTDGGKTWTYGGGFTRRGGNPKRSATAEAFELDAQGQPVYEPGIPLDKYGQPARYVMCHFGHDLPHPDPTIHREPADTRLVRSRVTVEGGSVMTRLHVVGTPGASHDKSLIPED